MDFNDSFTEELLKRNKDRKQYMDMKGRESCKTHNHIAMEEPKIVDEDLYSKMDENLQYLPKRSGEEQSQSISKRQCIEKYKDLPSRRCSFLNQENYNLEKENILEDHDESLIFSKPNITVKDLASSKLKLGSKTKVINGENINAKIGKSFDSIEASNFSVKSKVKIFDDKYGKSFEPSELPLSARRALFERGLSNSEIKTVKHSFGSEFSVAQRAALFEIAAQKNSTFRPVTNLKSKHFNTVSNISPHESSNVTNIVTIPSSLKSPTSKEFPFDKIGGELSDTTAFSFDLTDIDKVSIVHEPIIDDYTTDMSELNVGNKGNYLKNKVVTADYEEKLYTSFSTINSKEELGEGPKDVVKEDEMCQDEDNQNTNETKAKLKYEKESDSEFNCNSDSMEKESMSYNDREIKSEFYDNSEIAQNVLESQYNKETDPECSYNAEITQNVLESQYNKETETEYNYNAEITQNDLKSQYNEETEPEYNYNTEITQTGLKYQYEGAESECNYNPDSTHNVLESKYDREAESKLNNNSKISQSVPEFQFNEETESEYNYRREIMEKDIDLNYEKETDSEYNYESEIIDTECNYDRESDSESNYRSEIIEKGAESNYGRQIDYEYYYESEIIENETNSKCETETNSKFNYNSKFNKDETKPTYVSEAESDCNSKITENRTESKCSDEIESQFSYNTEISEDQENVFKSSKNFPLNSNIYNADVIGTKANFPAINLNEVYFEADNCAISCDAVSLSDGSCYADSSFSTDMISTTDTYSNFASSSSLASSCDNESLTESFKESDENLTKASGSVNSDGTLSYTLSFYRKQKQASRMTHSKTTDHKNHKSISSNKQVQSVKQQIKLLQEEMIKQQTIIGQTSQFLNLCQSTAEFSGSTEQVEGERLLLFASQKRQALMKEIQRLKTLRTEAKCLPDCSGTLTISDLQLPLNQDYLTAQLEAKINDVIHWFICLIRYGSQVIVTQLSSTDKISNGILLFNSHIKLHNLPPDFSILFEVYALKTKKEKFPHDKKYHIKREKTFIRLHPKGRKSDNKLSVPAFSNPRVPNAIRSSSFGIIGFTRFTTQNTNKKCFPLDKVPFNSPIEGIVRARLHLQTEHNIIEKGFLTMFEDVSGFGAWHRRWCVLNGHYITYWKYPDDEQKKGPDGLINLKQCVTSQVKSVSRDICARPHTFQLVTVRPIKEGDIDTLISQLSKSIITTKHLLSADTKEERIIWCNKLNETLLHIRKWDPQALCPEQTN